MQLLKQEDFIDRLSIRGGIAILNGLGSMPKVKAPRGNFKQFF